jgi:hypothetical protein
VHERADRRSRRTNAARSPFSGYIRFAEVHVRLSFIAAAVGAALLAAAGTGAAAPPASVTTGPGGSGDTLRLSSPHPIPTTIAAQPGPVRLDGCFSDSRGSAGLTLVHHAVRVANTGDRAISAVRVRFVFYDAFNDVNATRTNIAEARIEPNQFADRINLAELADSAPPARIVCSVDAVRYADGTVVRT